MVVAFFSLVAPFLLFSIFALCSTRMLYLYVVCVCESHLHVYIYDAIWFFMRYVPDVFIFHDTSIHLPNHIWAVRWFNRPTPPQPPNHNNFTILCVCGFRIILLQSLTFYRVEKFSLPWIVCHVHTQTHIFLSSRSFSCSRLSFFLQVENLSSVIIRGLLFPDRAFRLLVYLFARYFCVSPSLSLASTGISEA